MGKIKKGILGGFSGKVGTVVGASWRGIAYMRSLPLKVRNPRTVLQVAQRTKFSMVQNYLKPMYDVLRIGWKRYAHRQTPINAATSYTLNNAIVGAYPHFSIEASNVLISHGRLTSAPNISAAVVGGNIEISWDSNGGTGSAKDTDTVLVAVLNNDRNEAVNITAGVQRNAGAVTVELPAEWLGGIIHVYLGFISEDGQEVANSAYLGYFNI